MKLTAEEQRYLKELLSHARGIYGRRWNKILEKKSLPLPTLGFNQKKGKFEKFDPGKEEKVIKQLQKKNIVVIREEETDIQRHGDFQDKYGDRNNKFIGIRPEKLKRLLQQLEIEG
jgi:hypothetical protein